MCELQRDSAQETPSQNSWLQNRLHYQYKKQRQKNCKGSQILIVLVVQFQQKHPSYCFSFYQEPIQNNSWKHKPPYYPSHYQVVGVFVFCFVYCETGLPFFLPARNQKLIISITRLIWLWEKKTLKSEFIGFYSDAINKLYIFKITTTSRNLY